MRTQSLAAVLVLVCAVGFGAVAPARADGGTGSPFQPVGPIPHFDSGAFFFGFQPQFQFFEDVSSSFPFITVQGIAFDGWEVFPFTAIGQVVHIGLHYPSFSLTLTIFGQVDIFFPPDAALRLQGTFDTGSDAAVTTFVAAVEQSVGDALQAALFPFGALHPHP